MALQANIPNRSTQVSANPAGLNEHLVKDATPTEPIDFQTRIDSELAALNQAVEGYNNDNGKTQATLINARQEVNRIAIELENAKRKLQNSSRLEARFKNTKPLFRMLKDSSKRLSGFTQPEYTPTSLEVGLVKTSRSTLSVKIERPI